MKKGFNLQKFYRFTAWLLVGVMIAVASACGKISSPTPIEGSGYPHSYPRR